MAFPNAVSVPEKRVGVRRRAFFALAAGTVFLLLAGVAAFVFRRNAEDGDGGNAFDAEKTRRALISEAGIRHGDLILRHGNGLWSDFIRRRNPTDDRFSHIGILVRGGNGGEDFSVIHADCNAAGQGSVRKEPLAAFLREASRVGIFRPRGNVGGGAEARVRRAEAFLGLPFDWKFDLDDASALYCTELVWRAVSDGNAPPDFSAGTVEAGGRKILTVEAFVAPEFAEELFDSAAARNF